MQSKRASLRRHQTKNTQTQKNFWRAAKRRQLAFLLYTADKRRESERAMRWRQQLPRQCRAKMRLLAAESEAFGFVHHKKSVLTVTVLRRMKS